MRPTLPLVLLTLAGPALAQAQAQAQDRPADLRDLGAPDWQVRSEATARLVASGRAAWPELLAAREDPDLEVAVRARRILRATGHVEPTDRALLRSALADLADADPGVRVAALARIAPFLDVDPDLPTRLLGGRSGRLELRLDGHRPLATTGGAFDLTVVGTNRSAEATWVALPGYGLLSHSNLLVEGRSSSSLAPAFAGFLAGGRRGLRRSSSGGCGVGGRRGPCEHERLPEMARHARLLPPGASDVLARTRLEDLGSAWTEAEHRIRLLAGQSRDGVARLTRPDAPCLHRTGWRLAAEDLVRAWRPRTTDTVFVRRTIVVACARDLTPDDDRLALALRATAGGLAIAIESRSEGPVVCWDPAAGHPPLALIARSADGLAIGRIGPIAPGVLRPDDVRALRLEGRGASHQLLVPWAALDLPPGPAVVDVLYRLPAVETEAARRAAADPELWAAGSWSARIEVDIP